MLKHPADPVTLSEEEGEVLIAQGHWFRLMQINMYSRFKQSFE
jgi:hypothetical protein